MADSRLCGLWVSNHFAERCQERGISQELAEETLRSPFAVRHVGDGVEVVSRAVVTGNRRQWLSLVRTAGVLLTAYWRMPRGAEPLRAA